MWTLQEEGRAMGADYWEHLTKWAQREMADAEADYFASREP